MDKLINLTNFIEQNFEGLPEEKKLVELPSLQIPGVVLKNSHIHLSLYTPEIDYLYHQGLFMGFNPEFNNLDNLKKGYFGNPEGYTYLSSDTRVKPSRPLTDLCLKIDYNELNQQVYRDPETFLEKYHYEWNRAFMMRGGIPKSAIVEISFPENIRLIPELRRNGGELLNLDQYFERIKQIRNDFEALF
ncbi:MAG: hypothetical protein Q8L27_04280 [archaeon]|nr:hypothetical protein [archaeon]